jgi:hypothetical protein
MLIFIRDGTALSGNFTILPSPVTECFCISAILQLRYTSSSQTFLMLFVRLGLAMLGQIELDGETWVKERQHFIYQRIHQTKTFNISSTVVFFPRGFPPFVSRLFFSFASNFFRSSRPTGLKSSFNPFALGFTPSQPLRSAPHMDHFYVHHSSPQRSYIFPSDSK